MRRSGIYRIELGNGNFYIGSAVDLARREREHHRDLRRVKHSNIKMQNCWNKYSVFESSVLEECAISDLIVREQTYLDQHFGHPKNVNICSTAGSTLGRVMSVKTKLKLSAAHKGIPLSAETKAKMSAAQQNMSDETKAKISAAQKGKTHSAETKAKMSALNKGRVVSAQSRANISAALKGRTLSVETKLKLSAAHKGIPLSAEHRANISSGQIGRIHSAETKLKMSVAAGQRWAKFRMEQLAMEEMEYGKECS